MTAETDPSFWIGAGGLLLTGGGTLAGSVAFILSKIASVQDRMQLTLEKRDAENSKARHDMRNDMTGPLARLEMRITRVEQDGVRREDLKEVEARMNGAVVEVKQKVEQMNTKADQMQGALIRIMAKLGIDKKDDE